MTGDPPPEVEPAPGGDQSSPRRTLASPAAPVRIIGGAILIALLTIAAFIAYEVITGDGDDPDNMSDTGSPGRDAAILSAMNFHLVPFNDVITLDAQLMPYSIALDTIDHRGFRDDGAVIGPDGEPLANEPAANDDVWLVRYVADRRDPQLDRGACVQHPAIVTDGTAIISFRVPLDSCPEPEIADRDRALLAASDVYHPLGRNVRDVTLVTSTYAQALATLSDEGFALGQSTESIPPDAPVWLATFAADPSSPRAECIRFASVVDVLAFVPLISAQIEYADCLAQTILRGPRIGTDHWHATLDIWICGEKQPNLPNCSPASTATATVSCTSTRSTPPKRAQAPPSVSSSNTAAGFSRLTNYESRARTWPTPTATPAPTVPKPPSTPG